jgi:hypothetical protein
MTFPRDPGETPGESEFGWGEGLMPDPNAEPPHPYHLLKMAKRVNYKSDDPTAVETFDDEYKPRA